MFALDELVSASVSAAARDWFSAWELEPLTRELRLRYSKRMFRTVGRCYPQRREVVLAAAVQAMDEALLLDILCHEFAHIAAYEHYGPNIRPHGPEWQGLMSSVGFLPSVRFDDPRGLEILAAAAPRRRRYLHVCPRCQAQRISARRMTRWRCGACYEIGASGRLQIVAVQD